MSNKLRHCDKIMEETNVAKFENQAPTEPNISVREPYEHLYVLRVDGAGKAFAFNKTLRDIIGSDFEGYGRVDLYQLDVRYKCRDAGLTVKMGVGHADFVASADVVSMRPGGLNVTSNAMNAGTQITEKIVIPGLYSRQIVPVSSMLPGFRLYLTADAKVDVALHIYLKTYGPRIVARDLPLN